MRSLIVFHDIGIGDLDGSLITELSGEIGFLFINVMFDFADDSDLVSDLDLKGTHAAVDEDGAGAIDQIEAIVVHGLGSGDEGNNAGELDLGGYIGFSSVLDGHGGIFIDARSGMCLFDGKKVASFEFGFTFEFMENTFENDGVSDDRRIIKCIEIDLFALIIETSDTIDGNVAGSIGKYYLSIVVIDETLDGSLDLEFHRCVFAESVCEIDGFGDGVDFFKIIGRSLRGRSAVGDGRRVDAGL